MALIIAAACLSGTPWLLLPVKADDPTPSLAQQARDILHSNCLPCHAGARAAKRVDVTQRDALINRRVVIAGDSAHSRLIQVIINGSMPPGPKKVSPEDLSTLKQWIDAGAADWAAPAAATGGTATTGGTTEPVSPTILVTPPTTVVAPPPLTVTGGPTETTPGTPMPGYHLIRKSSLPGEGGWDYLTVDSSAQRIYISRSTHVTVMNTATGEFVGDIPDTAGVHGIAIDPKTGHGFTSNGRSNSVTIFDTKTLKKIDETPVGQGPDAIIFDPATERVFTFNGQGQSATALDAVTGKVVGTIALPGRPEFAVADGRGHLYDNIEDKNSVVAINSRTLKVDNTWPLEPGDGPSGIAMDTKNRRLFSVCSNQMLTIMNADNGHIVSTQPIGNGPDACAYDPMSHLIYSPNGRDGTLTLSLEMSPDQYMTLASVPTASGARTIALDEKTHHIFTVSATVIPPPPGTTQPRFRRNYAPGSFVLLEYGS